MGVSPCSGERFLGGEASTCFSVAPAAAGKGYFVQFEKQVVHPGVWRGGRCFPVAQEFAVCACVVAGGWGKEEGAEVGGKLAVVII